jgi:hypothetical protein
MRIAEEMGKGREVWSPNCLNVQLWATAYTRIRERERTMLLKIYGQWTSWTWVSDKPAEDDAGLYH